jgi:hypothetical protein
VGIERWRQTVADGSLGELISCCFDNGYTAFDRVCRPVACGACLHARQGRVAQTVANP